MADAIYWLRDAGGASRRVTPGGLILGRSSACDILLASANASRRQALVFLSDEGPQLAVLGKAPVTVDGTAASGTVALSPDSTVEIAGAEFALVSEAEPRRSVAPLWVIETATGGLFSFGGDQFRVGGGEADDLRIETLPAGALTLHAFGSRLEIESECPLTVDGQPIAEGERGMARNGSRFTVADVAFRVVTGGDLGSGSTVAIDGRSSAATMVHLEFLPRGGRLTVSVGGEPRSVYLADRRCDFVAVLLAPPASISPGDFVADEHVWNRVWGKRPSGRKTLIVLLHRLRRDLDRAGLDGGALLERLGAGGATRFVLASGADVRVE